MRSRCVRTGARKMHVVIHAVPWGRGWAGPHPSSTQASSDCLGRGGLAFDAADSDPEVYGGGTGLSAVHRTWGADGESHWRGGPLALGTCLLSAAEGAWRYTAVLQSRRERGAGGFRPSLLADAVGGSSTADGTGRPIF